jgi:hypothetical protein
VFPEHDVDAALDLLHLADMACHDCYPRELEVEHTVLADILLLSCGDLATLIRVTRNAIIDFRDVRLAADSMRSNQSQ